MAILGYSLTPKTNFENFSFFKNLFFLNATAAAAEKFWDLKKVRYWL